MSSSLYSCKVGLGGALSVFCAVEVGKQGDGLASRGHQVGTAVSGMTPSVCHSLSLSLSGIHSAVGTGRWSVAFRLL